MSLLKQQTTRRDFLRQSGQAAVGIGVSSALSSFAAPAILKAAAPNEQIRIGCIGVGNQGTGNLGKFLKDVVAVCEVDSQRLGKAKETVEKGTKKTCAAYDDYRKLLDDKNVDAVVITTPDHWHALMTVDACAAGKDVYCEKPLSLTVAEGRVMVQAARKHGRIVQTGSQQRSDARFRQACELVRNGYIGKVHTIKAGLPGNNYPSKVEVPPKTYVVADTAPPPELNFDLWLGPAPLKAYNKLHVHYNFRFFWDYSGGQLTNFGAHHLDIAQWALGMDDSGPLSIDGKARFQKDGYYEVPEWCNITYKYANGVTILCGQDYKGGVTFEGEKGTLFVDRKVITSTPADIVKASFKASDVRLYASDNHHTNWLECIKSRKAPICDVEIGHRSATVCHLGNIAARLGRTISWDPVKEEITGDPEAAKMLSRPYREPWKLRSV